MWLLFLEKAQSVINQLEGMNSTNTLDFSIGALGKISVEVKPDVVMTYQSVVEKMAIDDWVSKNSRRIW